MLANLEVTPASQPPFTFGTISCGADTWKVALGRGRQAFSMDSRLRSDDTSHRSNYHRTNWSKYPNLDLLIIKINDTRKCNLNWMAEWGHPSRARNLLVFHAPEVVMSGQGKWFKAWCKDIKGRGFDMHSWHIQATDCGASIWSSYFVTFCFSTSTQLDLPVKIGTKGPIRACRNLIRTYGVSASKYHPISSMIATTSPVHYNMVGTLYGQPVYDWEGPFSSIAANSWILIPDLGIRKVQLDELMKMKGLTDSQYTNITYPILRDSIDQHVWACIGAAITPHIIPPGSVPLVRIPTHNSNQPTAPQGVALDPPPVPSTPPILQSMAMGSTRPKYMGIFLQQ